MYGRYFPPPPQSAGIIAARTMKQFQASCTLIRRPIPWNISESGTISASFVVPGFKVPYPLCRDNQKAGTDARALHTRGQWRRQKRWCLYLEDSPGDRRLQQRLLEGETPSSTERTTPSSSLYFPAATVIAAAPEARLI